MVIGKKLSIKEQEYKLLQESVILRSTYLDEPNFKRAMALHKKQDELYKKWKFYKKLRKEMEKLEK